MRVWEGIGLNDDFLAKGYLVDMPIFFHLYHGEWKQFIPLRYIPEAERSEEKPYNYEVQIVDGRRYKMDVLFEVTKYTINYLQAPLGSWCILEDIP